MKHFKLTVQHIYSSVGKEFAFTAGHWVQSLGREYPLEKGSSNPVEHSCLKNPMDRRAWWATSVHRVERVGHDLATKPAP